MSRNPVKHICSKEKETILLNLNNAVQHARSHHCGVGVLYSCNTCGKTYKNKHAAQCHVPKWKRLTTGEAKIAICGILRQVLKNQRNLLRQERLVHPLDQNEKRANAATKRPSRGTSKGYGNVWLQEEVHIMIRLEKSLQGHRQKTKQMMDHLPGKTAKQIRDKRRESSYKAMVDQYIKGCSKTTELLESKCSSSVSEIEIGLVPNRYVSETESELFSDQGEVTREPGPSPPIIGKNSSARRTSTEYETQPSLTRPAGEDPSPSQEGATKLVIRMSSPTFPIVAGNITSNDDRSTQILDGDAGVTTSNETQWRTEVIRQALAKTRETSTMSDKCTDFHSNVGLHINRNI